MHRNAIAAVVQLFGIAIALFGAFSIDLGVGLVAVGAVVLLLGIDLEGGDR